MEDVDKRIMEVARSAVNEYLERLMNTHRDAFLEEHGVLRNGFYERTIKNNFGEIDDLTVTRDREGKYRAAVFKPYNKPVGVDELIISLYSKGISTRKASGIL